MVEVEKTRLEGDWEKLTDNHEIRKLSWARFTPVLYKGNPGAIMRFRFKGSALGFYDAIGPGVGIIEVTVDGKKNEINRFDVFCTGYRCHAFFIKDLAEGVHDVEVRVTGNDAGKAKIMSRNRDFNANEAKFKETAWYPANIMIVGEFIDK